MERTRTYSWQQPQRLSKERTSLTGLEYAQARIRGEAPTAPFASTLGLHFHEAEKGRLVLTLEPEEFLRQSSDSLHGGALSSMLDMAISGAVNTLLTGQQRCTTLDLHVNFISRYRAGAGTAFVEGKVVHAGKRIAHAEGWVRDAEGRVYAKGVSAVLIDDIAEPKAR